MEVIKAEYYPNSTLILALLFLVPPIGVYLLWAYTNWSKVLKQLLSALFLLLFLVELVFAVIHFYDSAKELDYIPQGATVSEVKGSWGLYKDNELVEHYSGLATNEHGTWVIDEGYVDFDYNGAYSFNDETYNVVNGKVL